MPKVFTSGRLLLDPFADALSTWKAFILLQNRKKSVGVGCDKNVGCLLNSMQCFVQAYASRLLDDMFDSSLDDQQKESARVYLLQ